MLCACVYFLGIVEERGEYTIITLFWLIGGGARHVIRCVWLGHEGRSGVSAVCSSACVKILLIETYFRDEIESCCNCGDLRLVRVAAW